MVGNLSLVATDLAGQPMVGLPVQAGGDSHLMNFGAFVTPEDNILFDVNDFDETLPGVDFTVDLKRLAGVMASPVMVDLRNIYRPDDVKRLGFTYSSVGR